MILVNKHNLALADFAAKEESRYTLHGIQITTEETVVTDGHVLARVTLPAVETKNFPIIEGFTPNGFTGCLLPTEACKEIEKALPKKTKIPILANAAFTTHEEKIQV